ncbi:PREDICTED: uncharacterized protein LOC106727456 [Myotis brandtii]|uniref:uncharacterized protein LOC106727456 n=1 Tax=Myotis brandtii TaxID=109478 RepID=UPI000703F6DD|nr:PREDICTED: uncharacterized protein LOC106727456 [Myotis brandtii]
MPSSARTLLTSTCARDAGARTLRQAAGGCISFPFKLRFYFRKSCTSGWKEKHLFPDTEPLRCLSFLSRLPPAVGFISGRRNGGVFKRSTWKRSSVKSQHGYFQRKLSTALKGKPGPWALETAHETWRNQRVSGRGRRQARRHADPLPPFLTRTLLPRWLLRGPWHSLSLLLRVLFPEISTWPPRFRVEWAESGPPVMPTSQPPQPVTAASGREGLCSTCKHFHLPPENEGTDLLSPHGLEGPSVKSVAGLLVLGHEFRPPSSLTEGSV